MAELLVVINGEPIAVDAHNLRTVGSCVSEAFARSSQRQLPDYHYFVRTKDGESLSSKDRIDYLDRIFVTLDAPIQPENVIHVGPVAHNPVIEGAWVDGSGRPVQRDPGDETDHRHRFDELSATCDCGATHEQLRRH